MTIEDLLASARFVRFAFAYVFVLFLASLGLAIATGRPSGDLMLDLIGWAVALVGLAYGVTRLAVRLRRRRFAEPPHDPPPLGDLLMYAAGAMGGGVMIAWFAPAALAGPHDRAVNLALTGAGVFLAVSPIAPFVHYVRRP